MKLPRPRRSFVLAVAVALAIALPAVGAAAVYAYAGDIPRGTVVLGVDIGAMSEQEAAEALTAGLAEQQDRLSAPVTVQVGSGQAEAGPDDEAGEDEAGDDAGPPVVEVTPAEIELAVDVAATVERAASGWRNPLRGLFGRWLSPREVEPVVTVDTGLLDAELGELADVAGTPMTKPEIRFDGTEPVPVYPEPGVGFDPDRAAETLTSAWPPAEPTGGWREPEVVALPLGEVTPVTTAEDVDRLVAELARPAVAAPVSVELPGGNDPLELTPEVIAESLQLTADEYGEIVPQVDPEALRAGLADQLEAVESPPTDAQFVIDGDEPEIKEGAAGQEVDLAQLAEELLAVLPEPEPRVAAAGLSEREPELDADDLAELGVEQEVATFSTDFSGGLDSPRSQNIVLISEMVDDTLVLPGEVFSLNGHTGPRDYDQGFQDAPVIIDGRLQPAVGGGLSQFTTTLFNAAFYSGLEILEHQPHSYYYSRYPAVLESTIFYGSIDLKFRNNTDHGLVIETSYTDDSITVAIWGTPVWDEVDAEWGERRDPTSPERQYVDPGPSCIDTSGIPGFTQDAWRIFYRDGEEVDREVFTWRYDAQPEVICAEDPEDD